MSSPTDFSPANFACLAQADEATGLLAGFVRRDLPRACLLSAPGDGSDQVFVVRSGRLRVYLAGDNRELNLSFLEPGDIYTTHTPTYIQAVDASSVWVIDTRSFARKLATDPAVTPVMMRVLGRLLANAVTLVEDLAFREVPARLARFFVQLAERRGKPQDAGWLVPLDLTVQDIASLLGTTRQTVSSLINEWEREGVVQRQGRRSLRIPSLEVLCRRCAVSV